MRNFCKNSLIMALLAFFAFACGGSGSNSSEANANSAAANALKPDDSAQRVETIQKQGFEFVYRFQRKDGGALDSEDKRFLRANSPLETNQWIVTDDGKAAIAGSNYGFPPANLEILKSRFNVEDLSKPKNADTEESSATEKNTPANVGINSNKGANTSVNKNANR